ncbi:GPO family capsid scaffolding protein, partial [Ralstonia solanacearum]|uniref:GPO family capsid scaffolding protein n=1 Tax=Ralstonia solanacearum TaxID=305 RepID=UPI0018D0EA43
MAKGTKFFRIATEGATSDGRVIDRETLVEMADNYDPKVYAARINLEHIRGYDPAGPFKAYGDVTALKAEEQDGKIGLLAQIDPTDDLVAMTKARQKVFSSMEVQPEFADTGEAYLVGLAVTDNPASLGCEVLQFSAKAKTNPLAAAKQDPATCSPRPWKCRSLLRPSEPTTRQRTCPGFRRQHQAPVLQAAPVRRRHLMPASLTCRRAVQTVAQQVQTTGEQFSTALKAVTDQLTTLNNQAAERDKQFNALKAQLEQTDAYTARAGHRRRRCWRTHHDRLLTRPPARSTPTRPHTGVNTMRNDTR